MNAWPDRDGAAIDRYVRQLRVRHPKTAMTYRSELRRFQRFVVERDPSPGLPVESLSAWLRDRAAHWPLHLVIDRACKVDRFLEYLVSEGSLTSQPFALLRARYGIRAVGPIVRALLADDPDAALEALRRPPRFGSFLGPLMREHIELRRSLGFRYRTQAERFAAFDYFLQGRPDLTDQPLPVLVRAWAAAKPTLEHRWGCQQLGRDLTRAWRRIDPSVEGVALDRDLRRQVQQSRRRPYIYTPREVRLVLDAARALPSPRAPLRSLTAYTMLVLAYCAGLRLSELVQLDLGDVHLADGEIEIRNTKFFKWRRLPLSDSALTALREYLQARAEAGGPEKSTAPLFWRQSRNGGGRYARITAEIILLRVLRRAGLKPGQGKRGPRIHDLRHAFVCHRMLAWYQEGINPQARLPYLATYLGHKDINSTLVYLTVTQELLQLAGERFRSYAQLARSAAGGRLS